MFFEKKYKIILLLCSSFSAIIAKMDHFIFTFQTWALEIQQLI